MSNTLMDLVGIPDYARPQITHKDLENIPTIREQMDSIIREDLIDKAEHFLFESNYDSQNDTTTDIAVYMVNFYYEMIKGRDEYINMLEAKIKELSRHPEDNIPEVTDYVRKSCKGCLTLESKDAEFKWFECRDCNNYNRYRK